MKKKHPSRSISQKIGSYFFKKIFLKVQALEAHEQIIVVGFFMNMPVVKRGDHNDLAVKKQILIGGPKTILLGKIYQVALNGKLELRSSIVIPGGKRKSA